MKYYQITVPMTQKNGSVIVETQTISVKDNQTLADRGYSQDIIDTAIELPRSLELHEKVVDGKIKKDKNAEERAQKNLTPIADIMELIEALTERVNNLERQ